jgi:hypothetical protein
MGAISFDVDTTISSELGSTSEISIRQVEAAST